MIYLNNAATSYPKPPEVATALASSVENYPCSGQRGSGGGDITRECRELLGELFHCSGERIFFTSGATESFNLIVRGLHLKQVTVTACEHNAVLRPLYAALPDSAISIVPSHKDGSVSEDDFVKAVSSGTDAVFVNHCSNVTGSIQDLEMISAAAKKAGALLIVDVSQSAGIVPLDVQKLGIDILVFTGHKNLFGPTGIGGFYLREGTALSAVKYGGTGSEGDSVHPEAAELFEVGTQNLSGIAGLAAGLRFVLNTGVEKLGNRVSVLTEQITRGLSQLEGVEVYAPENEPRGGAVGFTVQGLSPADIGYVLLHGYGIELRTGFQCAPLFMRERNLKEGLTRVSVSALTPKQDVDQFLKAMEEISQGVRQ